LESINKQVTKHIHRYRTIEELGEGKRLVKCRCGKIKEIVDYQIKNNGGD